MLEHLIAKVKVFNVMLSCEEAMDNESFSTLLVQWHNSFEEKLALFYNTAYSQSYVQLYLGA